MEAVIVEVPKEVAVVSENSIESSLLLTPILNESPCFPHIRSVLG
jgi:hypothetical protein